MSNTKAAPQLTYVDLVCVDDFTPMGDLTTSDLQNYEQDIYHKLKEARASNLDDLNSGAGFETILSSSASPRQVQSLATQEALNDPRTVSASATVTQDAEGNMAVQLESDTDADHLALNVSVTPQGTSINGDS
jgi:hypothetical protein